MVYLNLNLRQPYANAVAAGWRLKAETKSCACRTTRKVGHRDLALTSYCRSDKVSQEPFLKTKMVNISTFSSYKPDIKRFKPQPILTARKDLSGTAWTFRSYFPVLNVYMEDLIPNPKLHTLNPTP